MKNILFIICFLFLGSLAYSQIKVTAPGDVGIGTTSPNYKLDVDGNASVQGANLYLGEDAGAAQATVRVGGNRTVNGPAAIQFINDPGSGLSTKFVRNNAGGGGLTHGGTSALTFAATGAASITLKTDNINRMIIKETTGRVGIGTSNPGALLHVNNSTVFKPGGGTWTAPSDRRLKKNIKPFQDGLEEILKINTYTFQYNGKAEIPEDKMHVGIIAQEMQEITPYAITDFEYQNSVISEEGVIQKSGDVEEYLAYDGSSLTYMLINAIQEQQEMIDDLKSELDDIKQGNIDYIQTNPHVEDITIFTSSVTLSDEMVAIIDQNQPNPFNGSTIIRYFIPENSNEGTIKFYSLTGQLMRTVNVDHRGYGELTVEAQDLPSGTYTYSFEVDGKLVETKKMVLTR